VLTPIVEGEQGDELFEQQDVGKINKGKGKAIAGGLSDIDDYNSDEVDSGTDSSSETEDDEQSNVKKSKLPTFKMPTSMRDYKWESGMYFACKQEFQESIRCYAIHSNRGGIKYKKNDKQRIRLICKSGCPLSAYCSYIPGQLT